jgi:hypothetical protein
VDSVNQTLRFTTWVLFFLFNFYSISPTYIVQFSSNGTGRQFPQYTHTRVKALTNKTFHLPGIEEMNGDFHHHDSQGNDLIRIEKKSAVTRLGVNTKPTLILYCSQLSDPGNSDNVIIQTRRSEIDRDYKQRVKDAFYPNITGLSPPSLLS